MLCVFTIVILVCLSTDSGAMATVVPAYSIYEEAMDYLNTVDSEEIIDMLMKILDERLKKEASEEAVNKLNKEVAKGKEAKPKPSHS